MEQNLKLYEADWDNINDFLILKELLKACRITMTFDVKDKDQLEEVQYLTSIKAIKEVEATLTKSIN